MRASEIPLKPFPLRWGYVISAAIRLGMAKFCGLGETLRCLSSSRAKSAGDERPCLTGGLLLVNAPEALKALR